MTNSYYLPTTFSLVLFWFANIYSVYVKQRGLFMMKTELCTCQQINDLHGLIHSHKHKSTLTNLFVYQKCVGVRPKTSQLIQLIVNNLLLCQQLQMNFNPPSNNQKTLTPIKSSTLSRSLVKASFTAEWSSSAPQDRLLAEECIGWMSSLWESGWGDQHNWWLT